MSVFYSLGQTATSGELSSTIFPGRGSPEDQVNCSSYPLPKWEFLRIQSNFWVLKDLKGDDSTSVNMAVHFCSLFVPLLSFLNQALPVDLLMPLGILHMYVCGLGTIGPVKRSAHRTGRTS